MNPNITTSYKLMTLKSGLLYPLFINKKVPLEMNVWHKAELHETPGYSPRCGFHTLYRPNAPHLKMKLSGSNYPRVWVKCLVKNYEVLNRPVSQGYTWYISDFIKPIDILSDQQVLDEMKWTCEIGISRLIFFDLTKKERCDYFQFESDNSIPVLKNCAFLYKAHYNFRNNRVSKEDINWEHDVVSLPSPVSSPDSDNTALRFFFDKTTYQLFSFIDS